MPLPLLLLTVGLVHARCADTAADLRAAVDRVLGAYVQMDEPEYERASQALRQTLDCLAEPPPPVLVRDIHLVTALDRFLGGQREAALGGLRAALDLDPAYGFPEEFAPPGHPLRALLEEARARAPSPRQRFLRPIEGVFYLDTRPLGDWPQGQPALVQWADIEHQVCWTGYLEPGQDLPASLLAVASEPGGLARCIAERVHPAEELPAHWSAIPTPGPPAPVIAAAPGPVVVAAPSPVEAPTPPPEPVAAGPAPLPPAPAPSPARPVLLRPLPLATAGGAAISAGLLVAALASRHALLAESERCAVLAECQDDPNAALDRLGALEDRTRGLGYATQVSAGLTTGLGIAAGISLAF